MTDRGTNADAGIAPAISPVDFAQRVLRVELWAKQEEVLTALAEHSRVAVKSGNGLGKGFSAAVAVLWFLYTHDPAIVLTTAPTFRQVRHLLWRQIHSLHRRAADELGGKLLDTRWELGEDRYAMGLSADSADQFQGFHSPNLLVVVDEAEGVSDFIYEAVEAVMTSAGSRLLLIGNPTTASGIFRRAFHEERSIHHCITISALDSPNVQSGRAIIPGLTTGKWVEERGRIWGEDNPLYRSRVLGQFPDLADNSLIRLSDIEAAVQRWQEVQLAISAGAVASPPEGDVVIGVDVARYGSDHSIILRRRGNRVEEIRAFNGLDTMEMSGVVAAAIREQQPNQTCVDEVGIGAGVVDRLRELGLGVHGVNVARPARDKKVFGNLRAEGFWRVRELFATGEIAIPPDQQLMGELAALTYKFDSQGCLLMDSKEDLRKRGVASPDRADALMLAFVIPLSRPTLWT